MSTLSVDTITGKSTSTNLTIGSTPVVSASANSLTIRGEGSNQTSIQQGLLKQWSSFGQNSAPFGANEEGDTFNTSTQSDESTAVVVVNLSSNMGNTTYSGFNSPHHDRSNGNKNYPKMGGNCVQATSSYKAVAAYANGNVDDCTMSSGIAGDLA